MSFVFLDGFADPHAVVPNFDLINQEFLDKILKAEVFVHSDGQLRAAHLILGDTPISKSFHRDYLRVHRLAPIQCAPNMFRILGCVDTLNERMGFNLTHHE